MSQSFTGNCDPLIIPDGGTDSNALPFSHYHDAAAICLQAPAAIVGGGTLTIEVSRDGITFATLYDGTADIAPPPAGKARQYTEMCGFNYFRIHASSAVTGDTTWLASKTWTA